MINRADRDKLALLLRRYAAGRITNDDLADEAPARSSDPAIRPLYEFAWQLYDDLSTHRAEGRHALMPETRRMIARWVLFLQSDLEYRWPRFSFMQIYNWPLNLLTFGWWERRKSRRLESFQRTGHFKVWPFFTTDEFKRALRNPRFLRGRAA